MTQHPISIIPATEAILPAVVDLIMAQQTRQHLHNPHLHSESSRTAIETIVRTQINQDALIALNSAGDVRGYAQPAIWVLKETSILLSFLTARNGIVGYLALPDPADEDATAVTTALLTELDAFWQTSTTSGDLMRWPSKDLWLNSVLIQHHFQLDSICAFRARQPFFAVRPFPRPHQHIRVATPDDEETLVKLFHEELCFHEHYTPFVRSSTQIIDAFRRKLSYMWKRQGLEAGAPLVLVVEQTNIVIAMAENTLLTVEPNDVPGFTPPGRYWCIDNVCVHEDFRGQGIGRLLLQAIEDAMNTFDLKGYLLWFNPDNPIAAHFWLKNGFEPLWTTYQRLHPSQDIQQL